jgi:hypothetical protein
MGGQTTNPYPLTIDIGVPGQLVDENLDSKVISFPAGEPIYFGRLCEVDSAGALHLVQGVSNVLNGGVGATNATVGVSVFDVAREQSIATGGGSSGSGFYNSGEMVPVLRKGRIFGAMDSNAAATRFGRVNVWHPGVSDPFNTRGVFTLSATATTVGSEISQCPAEIITVQDCSTLVPQRGGGNGNTSTACTWVCMLEVNLPGA